MTKSWDIRLITKLHRHNFGENIIEDFRYAQHGD